MSLREAAAVAVENLEIRLIEFGATEGIIKAGFALHSQARILEIHPTLDRDLAGLLIVGDPVRRVTVR